MGVENTGLVYKQGGDSMGGIVGTANGEQKTPIAIKSYALGDFT